VVPNVFDLQPSTILPLLVIDCAILTLAALLLALLGLIRLGRGRGMRGEEGVRRELKGIGQRLGAVEKDLVRIAAFLPRTVQGVGVVRFDAYPDVGGNISFSVALLDGQANGVILSSISDRETSRVYGKAVENGTSSFQLSTEELQALAIARGDRR
jgi:Protein of unknown function (DUF4446)